MRSNPRKIAVHTFLASLWFVGTAVVWADRLELVGGGHLSGELVNRNRSEDEPYIVRTEYGQISVNGDDIARVRVPRDEQKQYERILQKLPQTVNGHWRMAEWCKQQNLRAERRHHLQQVIQLDPDHEGARRALDYVRRDGEWVTRREVMHRRGYLRYKGQWRLPQDIAILEDRDRRETAERNYRNQIRKWRSWIGKRREPEAIAGLHQLDDPLAVPAITEQLKREKNDRVIRLYVAALGRIASPTATRAVVDLTLKTDDDELRLLCLEQIKTPDQVALASSSLVAALGHKQNNIVHRAAIGLSRLEDTSVVRPLIDALVTTHKVKIGQGRAGSIQPIFSSGPSGSSGGLAMGGAPKIKLVEVKNRPVLEALLALTDDVNFEFDQARWLDWLETKDAPPNINLRRDA